MIIDKIVKFQDDKKKKALVAELQKQAESQLFERVLCDVNDALTSILAVCDLEAKAAVPKVKTYIQRINGLLETAKQYHDSQIGEDHFNINLVVANLLDVAQGFAERESIPVTFDVQMSEVKPFAYGQRFKFEQALLTVLTALMTAPASEAPIHLELVQKNEKALIKIARKNCFLSGDAKEQLRSLADISEEGSGFSATLSLPLEFKAKARLVTGVSSVSITKIYESKEKAKQIKPQTQYAF